MSIPETTPLAIETLNSWIAARQVRRGDLLMRPQIAWRHLSEVTVYGPATLQRRAAALIVRATGAARDGAYYVDRPCDTEPPGPAA